MKRIPVLAFLLAVAPLTWAEEIVQEAEVVPPTEATDVPTADVPESAPPIAPEPSETSTVSPIAVESAAQSTVTPVESEPVGPTAVTSVSVSYTHLP